MSPLEILYYALAIGVGMVLLSIGAVVVASAVKSINEMHTDE